MNRRVKKKQIDVIDKVLEACYRHNKDALFIMSLMHQYEERGSLSKKQLEGLLLKAKKVTDISVGWLAAVEAIILKMPTRDKTPIKEAQASIESDTTPITLIDAILQHYPQHKRVLFFQSKLSNKQALTHAEMEELHRFHKVLVEKKKNG